MIERLNPADLHRPPGYHHVTVVQPGVTVRLAGQCPLDADGALVGEGDVVAQAEQVARNIESALAAAGARSSDVVRTVIYVASLDRTDLSDVWTSLTSSAVADAFSSAATLLGVAQLGSGSSARWSASVRRASATARLRQLVDVAQRDLHPDSMATRLTPGDRDRPNAAATARMRGQPASLRAFGQ